MGRIDILGNTLGTGSALYDPIDLFRFAGPGARRLGQGSVTDANFSINAGTTLLKLFNDGSNGGDYGDWASGTNDSFNAFSSSGGISGPASLTKSGSSTLILAETNTYTGGTTVSGGTLQIGNGGTVGSITGNVTDNANLAFNRSDAVAFAGIISGSGSVT